MTRLCGAGAAPVLALTLTIACSSRPGDTGSADGEGDASTSGEATSATSDDSSTTGTGACTPVISVGECDPWCQDCPSGQKCMPIWDDDARLWNDTRCVSIAPEAHQVGDACGLLGVWGDGLDDCEGASMCWNASENSDGTCVALCAGEPDEPLCPSAEVRCVMADDDVLSLCHPVCNPLDPSCGDGEGCYAYPNHGSSFPMGAVGTFVCIPGFGSLSDYQAPCASTYSCKSFLFCGPADRVVGCAIEEPGCCTPYCDTSAGPSCPDAMACEAVFEQGTAPPGLDRVGVCVL